MSAPRDAGETGSPIAGSKYLRAFCVECGAPMRVADDLRDFPGAQPRCRACLHPHPPAAAVGGAPAPEIDESDSWRALAADLGIALDGEDDEP